MADAPKISDWIAAGAAVVGVIVATGALVISVITLRLQVITGLKGQASRITLEVLAKGSSRIIVKVRNLSDLPISDLTGRFHVRSSPTAIRKNYRPDWKTNFETDQLKMGEEAEGSFGVIEESSGWEELKSAEATLASFPGEGRETSEGSRESVNLLRRILNKEASVQWLDGTVTFRDASGIFWIRSWPSGELRISRQLKQRHTWLILAGISILILFAIIYTIWNMIKSGPDPWSVTSILVLLLLVPVSLVTYFRAGADFRKQVRELPGWEMPGD